MLRMSGDNIVVHVMGPLLWGAREGGQEAGCVAVPGLTDRASRRESPVNGQRNLPTVRGNPKKMCCGLCSPFLFLFFFFLLQQLYINYFFLPHPPRLSLSFFLHPHPLSLFFSPPLFSPFLLSPSIHNSRLNSDKVMKGKFSLDSITTSDLNARMAAKKQSGYDRSSSVSDWSVTARRSPTNEHFPTNGVDNGSSRKKRQGWTEVPTSKRKVAGSTFPTGEDPFAGMNSRINYQQEIERLKALVPKVDAKRRSLPTKQRPQSPPQQQQQLGMEAGLTHSEQRHSTSSSSSSSSSSSNGSWYGDDSNNNNAETRAPSPPVAPPSLASSAQSSSFSDSQTSSVLSDDESESASSTGSTNKASATITEEEKARFMAFVRKWAGGCGWQAWGKTCSNDVIAFDDDSSLWAKSSPWESNRQRSFDNHYFSASSTSSTTTTSASSIATTDPFLHLSRQNPADYYYNCNPHYYPIRQEQYPIHHHLYTTAYYHEPKPLPHNSHPISAIGERNQPADTSAFRGISRLGRNVNAPFGVFVI
ncbi:hypothetical protein BX666DRAFT_1668689 [Dichotomocladium elegans]|nr:hypothetical protein BX666DRAFT_1668689 [Dichotomocladium elegans]